MKAIYLDNAAATPMLPVAHAAMCGAAKASFANPSALHAAAVDAKDTLADLRIRASRLLEVKSHEIIFTSGATEANNIAISGAISANKGSIAAVSAVEHDSVSKIPETYTFQANPDGTITKEKLLACIDDKTVVVSCIYVNNETGIVSPVKELATVVSEIRTKRQKENNKLPLYLHVDAAQAATTLAIRPATLGADLLTLNGSKIGGPKQSGCLFVSSSVKLDPIIFGGGQERGLRPGTEAIHQISGFVAALESAVTGREQEYKRLKTIQNQFESILVELGGKVVGHQVQRSPHISAVIFNGHDNETLAMQLSDRGIYVGVGSACHAGRGDSKVLSALGYSDEDARSVVRFSYSYQTTADDLAQAVAILAELL